MTVGFAVALDVDLSLEADDKPDCMLCDGEAVMLGITSTPCGHPQPLCLSHYEQELPKWAPGDSIWCHLCPKAVDNGGTFIRWEKA